MADIIISYAREDRNLAQQLADVFMKAGLKVWWDREISAGQDFGDMIEQKIRQSVAVIVLWSESSVKSDWVRGEASLAAELGRLVTVRLDDCNLPIRYRNYHSPKIFKSKEEFEKLLDLLQDKINQAANADGSSEAINLNKDAIGLTMTGNFWTDYWAVTKTGWKHPFSFAKQFENSAVFYKQHKKIIWIIVVTWMILQIALQTQEGGY